MIAQSLACETPCAVCGERVVSSWQNAVVVSESLGQKLKLHVILKQIGIKVTLQVIRQNLKSFILGFAFLFLHSLLLIIGNLIFWNNLSTNQKYHDRAKTRCGSSNLPNKFKDSTYNSRDSFLNNKLLLASLYPLHIPKQNNRNANSK